MDVQVAYPSQSCLVGALDTDDVMARFLKLVFGRCVAIGGMFHGVSI